MGFPVTRGLLTAWRRWNLGACAEKMVWTKPDFTEAAFAQDRYACLQQSVAAVPAVPAPAAVPVYPPLCQPGMAPLCN